LTAATPPRWALPAFAVAAAAGVAIVWRVDPNRPGSGLPACPFHAMTGLYCPGCGTTRALHALVHGDVANALAMNPMFTLTLPLFALLLLDATTRLPMPLARAAQRISDARVWAVAVIAFAVLRNLPWFPFNLLAPG
jgi:hypothetical protein